MDIQCVTCKATFLKTSREKAYETGPTNSTCYSIFSNTQATYSLTEHATNKHSKTLQDCFPSFQAAA